MFKWMRPTLIAAGALALGGAIFSAANYDVTTGSGTHILAIDGTNQGTSLCAAASTECPAHAIINAAGTEIGSTISTNTGATNTYLGPPGATACATDTGSCSLNALVQRLAQRLTTINTTLGTPLQAGGSIGNTTFAATQSGAWNIGNITGTVSLPTGASTSANQTGGGQKTQIVDGSGNVIASTSNNLNVQCANCSGSGVSTGDEASFTAGTSLFAGSGGFFQTTATVNPLTTGQQGMFQVTAQRALFSNLRNASGAEVGTAATPLQVSLANTAANATAMLVTGTGGTFPVTGTVTANLGTLNGAATAAKQPALGTAGTASSDVLTVQGIASMTPLLANPGTIGTWGLVVSTQNSATPTNGHLVEGQFNTTPTTLTSGNVSPLQVDNAGNLLVNIKTGASSGAVAQGSATSGQTGGLTQCAATSAAPTYTTATTNPVNCDTAGNVRVNVTNTNANGSATSANSSPVVIASDQAAVTVKAAAAATGGASTASEIVPANTTAVVVKSGAGTLYGVQVYNINAAPLYLKFYNATSATCGSGTPVKRLMIPAASTAANGAGSNVSFGTSGVNFSTGLTYCVTTGIADTDTSAPTAANTLVNVDYL